MTSTLGPQRSRRSRIATCLVAGAQLVLAPSGAGAETVLAGPTRGDSPARAAAPVERPARFAGTVAGLVTDSRTRLVIAGAQIEVLGTRLGGTSGADGRYRIAGVPAGSQVIVARRIGYTSERQTVTVADNQQATADFRLEAAAYSLEQVVVTGTAGGEQRRSLGNSVAVIDASDALAQSAAPDLTALISSRAPGTIVTPGTGRIGSGPTIQIRGRSSLSLSSEPIVYIDGVRVNNAVNQGPSGAGGSAFGSQNSQTASRLNDINPDDIASIEIIKGPAAATIYGTEAANGVIQIITKKGGNGPARWTVSTEQGTTSFYNSTGRMPTNYRKDASGNIIPWNGIQQEADSGRPVFTTGHTQQYSAAVSGGVNALSYYVSGTHSDDEGVEPNNYGKAFSGHANLNIAPSSNVDIATSLNYVRSSMHLGADAGVSPLLSAMIGHILLNPVNRGFQYVPPEVPQRLYDNMQFINRFTGGVTISHRPTSWFSHRLVMGMDFTSDDSRALERFATPDLAPYLAPLGGASVSGGRIGQTLRNNTFMTGEYNGTAKAKLTSSISSSSSVGWNYIRKQLNTSFLGSTNFPAPGLETVSSGTLTLPGTQGVVTNTTLGLWAQQQFGWNDKLFVTAALRIDNNSAFGEDFKWVKYPKFSASYVLSEEKFWGGLSKTFNTFKLRGAYGQSGTQPDAFAALRTFVTGGRANGESGVTPGSFGNENLKPERGKELELGFETELFHRLSLDFSYFSKHTTDAILLQQTAPSGGFPGTQAVNVGETKNHGIELQGNYQVLALNNLAWELNGNIGTNRDEVVDLGALAFAGSTNVRSVVGYAINGYWSKRVVSADRDPTTNAISNILCDGGPGNAPVSCATAPVVFIGTPTPKLTGAFSTTVTLWKRLALYGSVDFKRGHVLFNANEGLRCGLAGQLCEAFYRPEKYSTHYLASIQPSSLNAGVLEPFFQDASFFRLGEVSLSYQLPDRWLRPLGVTSSRLTLAGRNLHLWTNYAGLDPEEHQGANDQALLPPLRRFVATLNLTF